jgi:hypothetical protein
MVVIASCTDKSTTPLGTDRSIESKIEIGMWEDLDPNGRYLQLICRTEKIYPCCNWSLVYKQLHNVPDRIQIEFLGIRIPDICATALGPAAASIEIGHLSSGTYPLFIVVKDHVDRAWLQVTSASYSVTYNGGKWITFSRSELRRVPLKSLWGYAWGMSESLVQAYVDTLENLTEYSIELTPGDYGYFKADSTRTINWPKPDYSNICTYIYRFEGSWVSLETNMQQIARANKDSLRFEIRGSEGQELFSWMLAQEP